MNFSPLPGPGEQRTALSGIPEYFAHVISDLETRKLPFIWTLQKNVDGFSLSLKLPAKSPKRRRRHLESTSKDSLSRQQDHVKVPSRAVPDKEPTRATPKRKSPSCKQRDRNRRKRWKRKKKSPPPLDNHTKTSDSESDHETVQDSLSLVTDAIRLVVEDFLPTVTDTVVSEPTEDSLEDDPPPVKECAVPEWIQSHPTRDGCDHCDCGYIDCFIHNVSDGRSPILVCSGCEVFSYCSRGCQVDDWKSGHREYCKKVREVELK